MRRRLLSSFVSSARKLPVTLEMVRIGSATYVELRDRYEDGYRTKTWKVYERY